MTTHIILSIGRRSLACIVDIRSNIINAAMPVFKRDRASRRALALYAISLTCIVFSGLLKAQSFSELEALLSAHPQLQSMSYQAQAHRERSDAVMGLPDPVLSVGINNFPIYDPSFNEFLPTNKAIGLQQRFPSRASREARSAGGRAQANQTDEIRQQLLVSMRAELIALLHQKDRINKQTLLAEQRDAKYDQLIKVVESEVGGGRSSVFRLAEIEAERADVARSLIDLRAEGAQIDSRLMYLVGMIPDTSPPTIEPSVWSGNRMDFLASRVADTAVKISETGIDQAKSAWKPEWGAQFTYQQRDAGRNFSGDDWVSMMVTVTVPFWSKAKQEPDLRAAEARKAAAQSALNDAVRHASAQYAQSRASYIAAKQAQAILELKTTAIRNEIAAQRATYESGAGDYAPIIDGEIVILKLRAEIAAQQALSHIAAAQMNALLVTP
ncbi:TolC family protein [Arenicella xantha]|uniref:Outer membrane protein TolC n=1 Tax=Arenicella xantha TaxID=644221 RepID=A0A395JIT9_9GAMM|nr:TolC family protein [Arenicella xantha]RBP50632.1 outer membrane protein TolC [Arenicella xantha]